MAVTRAEGLTADWINAWLAAIGVCHLCPGVKLRWSSDPNPVALFCHDGPEGPEALADLICRNLPDRESLDHMAIARHHPDDDHEFDRHLTVEGYRARAAIARRRGDYSISSVTSDLIEEVAQGKKVDLPLSPFSASVPKGVTLWQRLVTCHDLIAAHAFAKVVATLTGTAERVGANGLGFDYLRIFSPTVPDGKVMVDPAVEVLAFFGLALFPIRGDGVRGRTRGWTGGVLSEGSFTWAAWDPYLDVPAIDALLDVLYAPGGPRRLERQLVARYASVPYRPKGSSDVTRGIASTRID